MTTDFPPRRGAVGAALVVSVAVAAVGQGIVSVVLLGAAAVAVAVVVRPETVAGRLGWIVAGLSAAQACFGAYLAWRSEVVDPAVGYAVVLMVYSAPAIALLAGVWLWTWWRQRGGSRWWLVGLVPAAVAIGLASAVGGVMLGTAAA